MVWHKYVTSQEIRFSGFSRLKVLIFVTKQSVNGFLTYIFWRMI